jgi:serine/threonine protein kinase
LVGGRYRLDSVLGAGGMGVVWRAYDERLHRTVAVKEVRYPATVTPADRTELTDRAMREARSAAALDHPHIVAVYDVVDDDDRPWIVMRLVDGQALDQVVAQDGPLDPERTARLGRNLLDALDAAHAAGIVHRDVKPSNVLIGPDGSALLTDFSIAAAFGAGTLTQTGVLLGSPGYIAPERVRGGTTGPATDLFGLGATLYFAVEGRGPFDAAEPLAGLFAAATQPHPPPVRAAALTPLLDGLLIKDPADRMTSAQARILLEPPAPTIVVPADAVPAAVAPSSTLPDATLPDAGAPGSTVPDGPGVADPTVVLPGGGDPTVIVPPDDNWTPPDPPDPTEREQTGPEVSISVDIAAPTVELPPGPAVPPESEPPTVRTDPGVVVPATVELGQPRRRRRRLAVLLTITITVILAITIGIGDGASPSKGSTPPATTASRGFPALVAEPSTVASLEQSPISASPAATAADPTTGATSGSGGTVTNPGGGTVTNPSGGKPPAPAPRTPPTTVKPPAVAPTTAGPCACPPPNPPTTRSAALSLQTAGPVPPCGGQQKFSVTTSVTVSSGPAQISYTLYAYGSGAFYNGGGNTSGTTFTDSPKYFNVVVNGTANYTYYVVVKSPSQYTSGYYYLHVSCYNSY